MGSNQILFAHMPDTMRMGMPGIGQGRPQRLMPGPKLGAVLLMCRTAASGTQINALNCGAFVWQNPNRRELIR